MSDITLSCMIVPESLGLPDFEAKRRVHVDAQQMGWDGAWAQLLRFALHGQGPDVSEIGSTWLSSLIDMDALRPLTSWSLSFLRDMERFFPAARWAIMRPGDYHIWAVPLLTDTRAIYYRRDWLQQAGVDEAGAFQTPASLAATLERLQDSGIEVPWAVPTADLDVLYNAVSFVWAAGGRVRSKDGRRLRLAEPKARSALRSFLSLHRFLAPPAQGLSVLGTDALFYQGQAAAVISGPWLLKTLEQQPKLLAKVGVVPVPGVPFIGGSHLVIWRHARNEQDIIALMKHLTSPEIQKSCFRATGNLPARLDVLDGEPFISDPRYRTFAVSLKSGRVLTVSYRWAAVEQRLVDMLKQLWADLAADPELDLDAEIEARVAVLIEELEHTLLATW